MHIRTKHFQFFNDYRYWVIRLYSAQKGDKYWDIYVQYDEHYFNIGYGLPILGDLRITREGEPWHYQTFQEMADQDRERARWKWSRWHASWRSNAEIRQIQKEIAEREARRLDRT